MRSDIVQDILWKDRKRIIFGLPWSFTKYSVTKDRLFISEGFLNIKDDEVRLYRVMDISLERSLWQRMFGLGTIKCCSADKTLGDFDFKNIKRPSEIKELISNLVEDQREQKRVVNRENMMDMHGHGDDEFDHSGAPFGNDDLE